jgi:carboxyl-terminal processing protease
MVIRLPKWFILCLCAFFLSQGNKVVDNLFEYSKNVEIFTALYKELGTNYVDEIEPGKLMKTGIDAMLKSLDPYTNFFTEYQAEEALIEKQGQYGGVGCRIMIRNHYPVVNFIEEGYAFNIADVRLGDVITSINGISLKDKSTDQLLSMVRGAPNTTFSIEIDRDGKNIKKQITRMAIKTASVSFSGLYQGDIAYVKLEEFGQNASDEIEASLKKMMEKTELKGVILDLRDNGGGLLNEAVQIVGLFVGENRSIVTLRGQNVTGPKNWITPNKALLPNTPLVVLVNEHSASASEVVSGSLQDMDRAVIMGQTSFGKGLVQNYASLPYRTQMKLTVAKYYTPSGRCIQRLQYNDRDENGVAKTMSTAQKKAFKTQGGRTVYEGGGIDPDVALKPYQG